MDQTQKDTKKKIAVSDYDKKGYPAPKKITDDLPEGADVKVLALSFNPLYVILSMVAIGLFFFMIFQSSGNNNARNITTGEFIQNLRDNRYSKVEYSQSGSATAYGKKYELVPIVDEDISQLVANENTEVYINDKMKEVNIDEFVKQFDIPSLSDLVSAKVKSRMVRVPNEIIIGDGYIIADLYGDGTDYFVKDVTKEQLLEVFKKNKIDSKSITITNLVSAANIGEFEKLQSDYNEGKIERIWIFNGIALGKINEEDQILEKIDYSSLNTDFLQFLQKEGIDFSSENVETESKYESRIDGWALISNLILIGGLGVLVFVLMRGLNGSSKGLMQFGQSKAKMFFGKKPEVTFKDVAGVDSAKDELNEIVLFLKDPKRFMKIGARIPKGLLLVGPPGTGKTLLARAIAGEAGVPFFHTSGSEFEEMLVGAGASRVRDLFAKAKKASPALIFIDEIDAVARKRGTTLQSSSTEQTLNQILVEMDGFEKNVNVIVIAATNRPDVLDPAILRPGRFDRRVMVELPDAKGREDILKIHAANKPLASDVDLNKVARRTIGCSGADLENILNEAAIIVAKDNRTEIHFHDIEEAANRVSMGRERKLERSEEELRKTAYHEAGHAIIAKLTPKSDPVHRITIVSRGMALGVTMQLPQADKYSQSYVEMESRLRVLMGGRAAEEIKYGAKNITSGASNDIEKATDIARHMVKQWGYSEKLGLVKYGVSNELQYLGYGYGEQRDFSDRTAQLIDEEVIRITGEAYKDAIKILKENDSILEKISDDLVKNEVIEGDEFDKYFKS